MADEINYVTFDDLEKMIAETDENKHTANNQNFTSSIDLSLQQNLHHCISLSEGDDTELLHTTTATEQREFISDSVDNILSSSNNEFVNRRPETVIVEEDNLGFQDEHEFQRLVMEEAVYDQAQEVPAEESGSLTLIDEGFFLDELNKFSQKLLRFDEYQFSQGAKVDNLLVNVNDFELVDVIAMIDSVPVYNSENVCRNDNESVKLAKFAQEDCKSNGRQAVDGKKQKRSRRRRKGANKGLEINDTAVTHPVEYTNCCENVRIGSKQLYSRQELEALRSVDATEQNNKWCEIYSALGPVVAKEYDDLAYPANHKNLHVNFDPRQQFLGNGAAGLPEDISSQNVDSELKDTKDNKKESVCYVDRGRDHSAGEDSDDDGYYDSMHRPAFYVEGEPDFDSGPPEDGLEYLRRVRWEAARVPNVKVVKPDNSKVIKEQTAYMPSIPDIAKCPEHMLPPKQWEDVFLSDFEELRLSLTHLEEPIPENSVNESLGKYPTLSTILSMDSVTRVSMLRRRVKSVYAMTSLSKSDCVWLFALCAAVDTPFDADTSASVRCLLRKCASLRAEKSELDDEVVMLNILATISGRYFGQAEN